MFLGGLPAAELGRAARAQAAAAQLGQLAPEAGVRDGVHVGVQAGGRLAEERRQHGHERARRPARHAHERDDGVRRPRHEPQPHHDGRHQGQAQLRAPLVVLPAVPASARRVTET